MRQDQALVPAKLSALKIRDQRNRGLRRPSLLVAGLRNPQVVFGCRVIVRRERPWESPH
jgi:hypothetical protein